MLSKQVLRARFWNPNRRALFTGLMGLTPSAVIFCAGLAYDSHEKPTIGYIDYPTYSTEYKDIVISDGKDYLTKSAGNNTIGNAAFTLSGNTTLEDDRSDVVHINGNVTIDGNLTVHGDIECKSKSTKSGTQTSKPKHKHKR